MQSRQPPAGDTEVRVAWSPWMRCESSFALVLAPRDPGVYAVAEEVLPVVDDHGGVVSRRMLAVLHFGSSDDLGRDLPRLFAVGGAVHDRLAEGRCYLRYAALPDAAVRDLVFASLQQWMATASEAATGVVQSYSGGPRTASPAPEAAAATDVQAPLRLPDGF